jgi:phage baseplate assembly protein gpV
MASTYSDRLNLELQTTGENSGTWGTITNNNLQKLEAAIKGYVSVAIASTSDALTYEDGSTGLEQDNAIIKLTGTLTGNTTMQCEAVENWFIVDNATSMGTYTLGFKPAGGTAASLVSSSKHLLYSDGSEMFDVLADAGNIKANGTLTVSGNVEFDGGTFIFNQSSADVDFRIESNGNANAFFVDAGNDRIGIFNASPSVAFDVTGAAKISGAVDLDGGAFTWNDTGASLDFRCETNTLANAFFIDGSADKIGFGTSSPADASVEINQASTTAGTACLSLDQDDTDQEFIKFDGTSNSDQSSSITTDTSVGSITGHIRVNINGTDYWIPFYATN